MNNKLIYLLFLLSFISCSRVQTINTVKYNYSDRPENIIWIQIAGFTEEQYPIVKFNSQTVDDKLFGEKADCVGKMWSYNLFELRPSANLSFLAQIFGLKNITNTCTDADQLPIWSKFQDEGFKISILENGTNDQNSLEKFYGCNGSNKKYFENLQVFKMSRGGNENNSFHYQETKDSQKIRNEFGIFYDKACQQDMCYSSMLNNAKKLFSTLGIDNEKRFVLIRDFNYQKALLKKDIVSIKESLLEIEQILKWARNQAGPSTLLIVTGAEPVLIEFPSQGKEWEGYVKTGKNISFKNTSLLTTVIAQGPSAENFCGLFEESDFLRRMQFSSPGKKFNWDNINPFNH